MRRTKIEAYSLRVEPAEHFVNWQQDPFGNPIARFVFPKPVRELSVTVNLIADMTVIDPFDFFIEEGADQWPFEYNDALKRQLAPYLEKTQTTSLLTAWVDQFPKSYERIVDFLVDVNLQLEGTHRIPCTVGTWCSDT